MTDASGQQISLDANVLDGTSDGLQITYQTEDGQTVTTIASNTEAADIVSKAFTTVADGTEANVEYVTMTPEEAAAAGVVVAAPEEEEQVVTTSLQFDPANPSVLYTADGTPINQADLTPEEQALVQAALQQHLAEQEAEQQLAMMQQDEAAQAEGDSQKATELAPTDAVAASSAPVQEQLHAAAQGITVATGTTEVAAATNVTAISTPVPAGQQKAGAEGVDLASPNTSASQIVQTLANNVRKQQMEDNLKLTNQIQVVNPVTTVASNFSEKIVIREGQPQVVKIPAKKAPIIPEALASLMPKVEIGKDGSQVIRIHQSQITPSQLKALQDNPNVRLVFRPASSSKAKPVVPQRKRGRPRKNPEDASAKIVPAPEEPEIEDPPAKTRCGRVSKRPVYTKDYLTPKISTELEDDDTILDPGDEAFSPISTNPLTDNRRPRGRPPGKVIKNRTSYASKIEALQNRDNVDALPIVSKPVLTPIEQALSTRRKNRLREMLSACSEDEIMEVAMPHIARVFSLWEFLVTKVEKNKMSRVYFADIYKEYECLHKYVSKLAEKYKQAVVEKKTAAAEIETSETEASKNSAVEDGTQESTEKEESKVQVKFAKLAESLGLTDTTLEEAEISLLDPEEAIGPRIMGMIGVSRARVSQLNKIEDKNARKPVSVASDGKNDAKNKTMIEGAKPVQTEATSTISTTHNTSMPPLKPLGQTEKAVTPEATAPVNGTTNGSNEEPQQPAETPMETDVAAQAANEAAVVSTEAASTGTQLIQIGQGEDQQFIEVPEGYTLIQTPEGLVMSQPGTTITQGEDGTIYITHADGTTTPLNAATQQSVPMETVESLLSLDGQQAQS